VITDPAEQHVLQRAKAANQLVLLKYHACLSTMTLSRTAVDQETEARDFHAPGRWFVEQIEAAQQGRFARARSAEQHGKLSSPKMDRSGMQSS
jgi:hypothetical protein